MEPATVIALTTAAIGLADKLVDTWSAVIGKDEMVVNIVNGIPDITMKLVYLSEDDDSEQHGKFVAEPASEVLPSGKNCIISSAKGNWTTYGNTNGVVYRVSKTGCQDKFLWICWENPYSGTPFYHIQFKDSWSRDDMRGSLLVGVEKRSVDSATLYSVRGMQRIMTKFSDGTKVQATGVFGTAPLKIVIHP